MPQRTLEHLSVLAKDEYLDCFGSLHSEPSDNLGEGTIVLLGPYEPGFWAHFQASPECRDGNPDPIDRWSTRVIEDLAQQVNGTPLFPFGEPARPFIGWALRSGQAFVSPASMLVHGRVGMFVSFRGAIFVPEELDLDAPLPNPCDTCETKPCLTACPPRAITADGYDLPKCHDFLDGEGGQDCMEKGCAVRRSCPLAQNYPRMDEHSRYHMRVFHPCP